MRWDESHESPDVIDRRDEEPSGGGGGGGLNVGFLYVVFWLLRRPWGWAVVLVAGVAYVFLRPAPGPDAAGSSSALHGGQSSAGARDDREAPAVHFVSFVLDDVQSTWEELLPAAGKPYRHAKLVLYTDETETACGEGSAATGPFYCPLDERVYLDLGFFHELAGKLGARGQFAQAYVVAHEVGHHVQRILGIEGRAPRGRGATGGSVRLELQADCFAGIWAHATAQRDLLQAGDIDSALGAAAAVGDDRLQRAATGTVSPESWTHGSSAERQRWFKRGYESGAVAACDTFHASAL
jgi:predicted metalloprotease